MTTPDRTEIVAALERWGSSPTAPPDALFVARLGRRLVDTAGATDDDTTEVDLGRRADVVPLRRRAGLAAVAAAAVLTVAGAAAAVATRVVDDRVVPAAPVDAPSTRPTSATTVAVVPVPGRTTLVTPTPAAPSTVTSVAGVTEPPTTSTPPPAPTSAAPTTSPTDPAAGTEPVVPARPEPPASTPPPTDPPVTAPPPTTTEVRSPASMTNSCSVQAVDGQATIVCEWSEPAGGAASYRVLRGIQGQSVGRVLTPVPGARRYVDRLVTAGTTYLYTVQALDAGGVVIGHSTMAVVTL